LFWFRLIGFEWLSKVFNEFEFQTATYNAETNPRNLTIIQITSSEIKNQKAAPPKLHSIYKKYKQKQKEEKKIHIHSPFANFGFNNNFKSYDFEWNMYENHKDKKKLSFVPWSLQIQCFLYHGCEELTEQVWSKEIMFHTNSKFDQWINFGDLRYCQLPKNTRLSFNIHLTT